MNVDFKEIYPGAIHANLMPVLENSLAQTLVNISIPFLLAEYAACPICPLEFVDEKFIIKPLDLFKNKFLANNTVAKYGIVKFSLNILKRLFSLWNSFFMKLYDSSLWIYPEQFINIFENNYI